VHVYRWDLDKTYLETDFDSVRGLVRSALEPAEAKRNVPGSAALLRALSSRPGSRVVFLSGSPTQMREVLQRKLELDGVRFDELHLKDNLGNLKRGRLRAIKGQFGYKLPALLRGRVGMGQAVTETCFGDDAEVDALVYSVFADAVAGRLSKSDVSRILQASGVYPDRVAQSLELLDQVATAEAVDRVFIHLDRGVPTGRFEPLGSRVVPVHSWFQAALVLYGVGHLDARGVLAVVREVSRTSALDVVGIANLFQDIARRGHVPLDALERFSDEVETDEEDLVPVLEACRRRVGWLGRADRTRPHVPDGDIDYLDLVGRFGRKHSKD
jgi:hypothetical protein